MPRRGRNLTKEAAITMGRAGGLAKAAKYNGAEISLPARSAFLAKFLEEQPPELPLDERLRRAQAALRLHMTRLARRSAEVRRQKARVRELEWLEVNKEQLARRAETVSSIIALSGTGLTAAEAAVEAGAPLSVVLKLVRTKGLVFLKPCPVCGHVQGRKD